MTVDEMIQILDSLDTKREIFTEDSYMDRSSAINREDVVVDDNGDVLIKIR